MPNAEPRRITEDDRHLVQQAASWMTEVIEGLGDRRAVVKSPSGAALEPEILSGMMTTAAMTGLNLCLHTQPRCLTPLEECELTKNARGRLRYRFLEDIADLTQSQFKLRVGDAVRKQVESALRARKLWYREPDALDARTRVFLCAAASAGLLTESSLPRSYVLNGVSNEAVGVEQREWVPHEDDLMVLRTWASMVFHTTRRGRRPKGEMGLHIKGFDETDREYLVDEMFAAVSVALFERRRLNPDRCIDFELLRMPDEARAFGASRGFLNSGHLIDYIHGLEGRIGREEQIMAEKYSVTLWEIGATFYRFKEEQRLQYAKWYESHMPRHDQITILVQLQTSEALLSRIVDTIVSSMPT